MTSQGRRNLREEGTSARNCLVGIAGNKPIAAPEKPNAEPKQVNRFAAFNPQELDILRVILNQHINTVSEVACDMEVRASAYLLPLEELEAELLAAWRGEL